MLVEEGKTVGINTVVARIDEGGGGRAARKPRPPRRNRPAAAAAPPRRPAPEPRGSAARSRSAARRRAEAEPEPQAEAGGPLSPLVRRMAREYNIDLARVQGTGAGGRITKQDVEAYLAQQKRAGAPRRAGSAPRRARRLRPRRPPPAPAGAGMPRRARVEPMSIMRAKIAEHMVLSKRTSAHVTTVHKVDMTKVAQDARAPQGRFPGSATASR